MKRWLAVLLVLALALVVTACGKDGPADEANDGSETTNSESDSQPAATLVTYGRISAPEAPTGWVILEESNDDQLVYAKQTEQFAANVQLCPYLRITVQEGDAKTLLEAVTAQKDSFQEGYRTEEVTIAGIPFYKMVPDLGMMVLYGNVDGHTAVLEHTKFLDEEDPAVAQIIGNMRIADAPAAPASQADTSSN